MSGKQTRTDQTVTLLKIQALLASAQELSHQSGKVQPHSDTKFLSYLIKMARMEVEACFEPTEPEHRTSENRDNLGRM